MLKRSFLALALTAGLVCPSCLGPNNAFDGLHDWNMEVTDKDWANELIFIGLTIIPVYGVVYLADILVLNTIDYWSE